MNTDLAKTAILCLLCVGMFVACTADSETSTDPTPLHSNTYHERVPHFTDKVRDWCKLCGYNATRPNLQDSNVQSLYRAIQCARVRRDLNCNGEETQTAKMRWWEVDTARDLRRPPQLVSVLDGGEYKYIQIWQYRCPCVGSY